MPTIDLNVIGKKTKPVVFEYTWRDVVLSGEYDLALRLHSKRTPQFAPPVGETVATNVSGSVTVAPREVEPGTSDTTAAGDTAVSGLRTVRKAVHAQAPRSMPRSTATRKPSSSSVGKAVVTLGVLALVVAGVWLVGRAARRPATPATPAMPRCLRCLRCLRWKFKIEN